MAMLITVQDAGEATRIWIGCDDMAETPIQRLREKGYKIDVRRCSQPPERSEEEKQRADQILMRLFAH